MPVKRLYSFIKEICTHTLMKYINYNGSYFTNSSYCPKRLEIVKKKKEKEKKAEFLKLQKSHKKITIIISYKSI